MNDRADKHAAIIEALAGGAALLAGLALAMLGLAWTLAFWLVVVGSASLAHAVTFGLGLIKLPSQPSATHGKRHPRS